MSHNDNVTEQRSKRSKITKEMVISDIASSIGHISKSIESLSARYSEILRINKNVITYLQKIEKREKEINQTATNIEHIPVERKLTESREKL